jgi:hypothetical protein
MSSQRREVTEGQNNERKFSNMKNRNIQLTAILFVVAFALGPIVQAGPRLDGGPTQLPVNDARRLDGGPASLRAAPAALARPAPAFRGTPVNAGANEGASENSDSSEAIPEQGPVITVHSTDNVIRGKTGSFVLNMKPALMLGGMYVNFSLKGTAVAGVDYVQPLSPAYIGLSAYGVIQIQTLPDPRGSSFRQAYSVVVTLEDGAGYALGVPRSATMWIKP